MKLKKSHFIFAIILFFLNQNLRAQNSNEPSLTSFLQNYNAFSKNYPQETVYLHFDNTEYFLGETIWFKAYVVRSDRNSLSEMSKILYVELLNREGNVLDIKKLKVENGQCNSEFSLDNYNYGGFYEIRAYTRYMLNFGENNYFSRVFAILDEPKKQDEYVAKITERNRSKKIPNLRTEDSKNKFSLTFYPEGGNLVNGLTSVVSFKAIDKQGKNADLKGEIYNENNELISTFSTVHNGMGTFSLMPGLEKYRAEISSEGKKYSFPLPDVLPQGYVLFVNNFTKDKVIISVQKSENAPTDSLGVAITCRGALYGFEKIVWNNENNIYFSLPKNRLPSGVSQITLFNKQGEIISQRMIFINHQSKMKISVTQNKQQYAPFDQINLKFNLSDKSNNPVQTNFSLSVKDTATSPYNPYGNNILSDLLLSSDLKGYIENPYYYFENDDRTHQQAVDLLMLTQGWTRYSWEKRVKLPVNMKQPLEKGLYVEGTITSLFKKKPKVGMDILMFLTNDTASQHGRAKTDSLGKFNFSLADFYGYQNLTIQTSLKNKRKENNIILNRIFSPALKSYNYYETQLPTNDKLENTPPVLVIDSMPDKVYEPKNSKEKIRMLDEVTVNAKKSWRIEGEGYRDASIIYDVAKTADNLIDNNKTAPANILEFLEQQNPYFNYNLTDTDYVTARYKNKKVIFCLNNNSLFAGVDPNTKLPKNEYNELSLFSIDDIKTITIVEQEGTSLMYSNSMIDSLTGYEVVIFIYTNNKLKSRNSETGIRNTHLQGYSQSKEFYNIDYNISQPTPYDHRRTLYWNPNVKTDEEGNASVSFFNNSSCKQINIDAETVTSNGIIGTYQGL